jgi:hypothetical protein
VGKYNRVDKNKVSGEFFRRLYFAYKICLWGDGGLNGNGKGSIADENRT